MSPCNTFVLIISFNAVVIGGVQLFWKEVHIEKSCTQCFPCIQCLGNPSWWWICILVVTALMNQNFPLRVGWGGGQNVWGCCKCHPPRNNFMGQPSEFVMNMIPTMSTKTYYLVFASCKQHYSENTNKEKCALFCYWEKCVM